MLTNWSYSRYGTWKKCPALLKFQMEDAGPRVSHPAAARGTLIHKQIEDYLTGAIEQLDDGLGYYHEYLENLRFCNPQPELPLAVDAQWNALAFDDQARWWRGVLDCVAQTKDTSIIIDWKTGQEYPDHREQREIYAAAYAAMPDCQDWIMVIHTYLDKKQNTSTTYHRDDIPKLRVKWEEKIEVMFNERTFAPNPGFYCRSCPYRAEAGGPCVF